MGRWRNIPGGTATALVAISLTACTTTISGAAQEEPGPPPTGVQTAQLDHGNYPIKPRPPLGTVQSAAAGRGLEGDRMANNVVLPYEVDPTLLSPNPTQTVTVTDAGALNVDLPDPVPAAAGAHNFIVGFSTSRSSATPGAAVKILTNLVMEFPDPLSAAAAAGDMAAKYAEYAESAPQQPFGIPRHPEALGSTRTEPLMGPDHNSAAGFIVSAFTAHGQYVLFETAECTDTLGAATELVARALDMQAPLIDGFTPSAPSQFADLPADPTGLLALTLPDTDDDVPATNNAVFTPRAYLHFADGPAKLADAFKQTGVQNVAIGLTVVYEARDASGAQRLADTEAAITVESEKFAKPIAGVDGYPAAKCFASDTTNLSGFKFYCVAPADRYLIEAEGQHDTDLRQQIAAQYLILTAR